MSKEIKKWQELNRTLLQKTRVFDLFARRLRSPISDYEDDFYYIEAIDWVNTIALTDDREVILVEQYRFGIDQPSLEIPGGMLSSPTDPPEDAARRELAEETGYFASEFKPLGWVHPNPAIQTNRCFFFFADNAKKLQAQNLDPAEDIAVHLLPLEEIPDLIRSQKITHSLVHCAFFWFFAKYGKHYPAAFDRFCR